MKKFEVRECKELVNNGQKIFAVTHTPIGKADQKWPAVMICHGLGGNKTGKYRLYVHLSEMLAKAGIASVRFDFRSSGDSEGDFSAMTIEGEVSDALLMLKAMEADPRYDNKRIGIFGRSFGGLVSVLAASRVSFVKSLALWAPVFEGEQWKTKWETLKTADLEEDVKKEMMRINGQVPGPKFFEELFALKLEGIITSLDDCAFLHIHGEKDTIVDPEHAFRYQESRKGSNGFTKFIMMAESDHDFSHAKEQLIALEETVQWFKQTL